MTPARSPLILMMLAVIASTFVAATAATDDPRFPPIPDDHLHNVHRVTSKVISGSQPNGDAAFQRLADLGVKTIISVDGARPNADLAARFGMRYVHLPIGYDGVGEHEGKALAKAMHELPGPIYVHCHHGKHRTAAAVAVACVLNGSLHPKNAQAVLTTFGTGENYKGLWQAARDARPLDPHVLAALEVKFVPAADIGPLADAMVQIDQRWEHLKSMQAAGWKPPQDHPDLDAAHEALLLHEHFRELARPRTNPDQPHHAREDFRRMLRESEIAAASLRKALAATPVSRPQADAAIQSLATGCKTCHESHRD